MLLCVEQIAEKKIYYLTRIDGYNISFNFDNLIDICVSMDILIKNLRAG